MNWAKEFQDAIDCIEEHLTENVDYNEIAKRACMSKFLFSVVFLLFYAVTHWVIIFDIVDSHLQE